MAWGIRCSCSMDDDMGRFIKDCAVTFKIILISLFGKLLIAAQHDQGVLIPLPESHNAIQVAVLNAISESNIHFAKVVAAKLAGKCANLEDIAQGLYDALCETDPDLVSMAQSEISPKKLIPAAQRLIKKL